MIRKFLLGAIAALAMIACNTQQGNNHESVTGRQDVADELIMSRRSIRKWQDRTISRDTLDIIMKHGINAPNGRGTQSYEVRVIDNPALLQEMSEAVGRRQTAGTPFSNIFVNAPCVVFIASYEGYDLSQVDCGLLGENIILSAWSMGIGSCCLGSPVRTLIGSDAAAPYIDRLGFSEGYNLLYCIALGYLDEAPAAKPRKEDKVRYVE